MSIKIKQGSATKDVNDVVFGTSGTTKKDVNKVVDWNGKVIWERASPKIDITGKLTYYTDPSSKDFYASGYDEFTYTYKDKYLGISNVEYTGTSPYTPLTLNTDYEVSYSGDTSGTITHSGYTTEHNNATAHIKGIRNYTGQVDQAYTITHQNLQTPPTPKYNFVLRTYSNTELMETTATHVSGNLYESDSNTITAKVKSTSESSPRVKLEETGTAYVSPHTFTCKNDQGTGYSNVVTFKFYSAANPSISSVAPWDKTSGTENPTELDKHTAGTPGNPERFSPGYFNSQVKIISDGVIVYLADGSKLVRTPTNTYGITINRSSSTRYGISIVDGETTSKYHTAIKETWTITSDGTYPVPSTGVTFTLYHISTASSS